MRAAGMGWVEVHTSGVFGKLLHRDMLVCPFRGLPGAARRLDVSEIVGEEPLPAEPVLSLDAARDEAEALVGVGIVPDVLRFLHEAPPLFELGMPGLAVDGILIVISTNQD